MNAQNSVNWSARATKWGDNMSGYGTQLNLTLDFCHAHYGPPLNGKKWIAGVVIELELSFLVCIMIIIIELIAVNLIAIV